MGCEAMCEELYGDIRDAVEIKFDDRPSGRSGGVCELRFTAEELARLFDGLNQLGENHSVRFIKRAIFAQLDLELASAEQAPLGTNAAAD